MPADEPLADLLTGASRALRRSWGSALEPLGLSPHHARALRVVGGSQPRRPDGEPGRHGDLDPGDLDPGRAAAGTRVSDLAVALRIAPGSATEVVDALVERGLAERASDPADRRAVLVRATDRGRQALAHAEAVRATHAEALFSRLDADERTELARLLHRLTD